MIWTGNLRSIEHPTLSAAVLSLPKRVSLAAVFLLGALLSTHGQAPSPLVFEPGFEGEIWQTLPKMVERATLATTCVPNWVPAEDDLGNFAGFYTPDPDVVSGNLCSPDEVPPSELLFPTDVAVYVPPDQVSGSGFPDGYRAYVADIWNHRVVAFRPLVNGAWEPVDLPDADWRGVPGPMLDQPLDQPNAVAVDADGNVWVADVSTGRIVVFDGEGRWLQSIPVALDGTPLAPYGIALAPGAAWGKPGRAAFTAQNQVGEPWDQVLGILDTATGSEVGRISSPYGSGSDEWAGILEPVYHVDSLGTLRLVVADADNSRLKVLDLDAQGIPLPAPRLIFGNVALQGDAASLVQQPYGLAVDGRGRVLVGDTVNQRMSVFALDLTPGSPDPVHYLYGLNARGGLNGFPRGIAEDPYGRLLIVDTANHEVEVFDIPELAIVDVAVSPLPGRTAKPVNVDFSVVVPETKYQVVDMMPTCQVTDGAATIVLSPFAIGGTDATLPLPRIQPMEVARYRCTYTPAGGATLEFELGASGNRVGATAVSAAPGKVATVPVLDCADCEETPPAVSAQVSSPAPVNGFYPSALTIAITAVDPQPPAQTTPGQVKRIAWRWLGAMAASPTPPELRCPGEPAGVQCVEFTTGAATASVDVAAPFPGRSTLQFWADDAFDNRSAVGELTFTFDATPPTVTFVRTPAPNAHGWWKQPVTITYSLADDWTDADRIAVVSPSIPSGTIVGTEGAGQTFSVTAQDLAGHRGTYSTTINLDLTAPATMSSVTSALSGPRTVTLSATDALSGVQFTRYTLAGATTQASRSYTDPIELTVPGTTVVTFSSVDVAGNEEPPRSLEVFVNGAPTANPDAAVVDEDMPAVVDVLDNDVDPNAGDSLAPSIVAPSPHGSALVNGDGTVTFTPNPNFNGTTAFTYRVTDAHGAVSESASVTVTVRAVNDLPVAVSDGASTSPGTSVVVAVLANDSDVDIATNGDILTPVIVSPSPNGTAVVNGDGTVTFAPNPGFTGAAVFSYRARDAAGGESNVAEVTVTVRPFNRPPVCDAAYASPGEIWPPNHKRRYDVTVMGVTDPDGDAVAIRITGVFQDEPVNTAGDGAFAPDGGGVGTATAWVRAERTGRGDGRVYEIRYVATDPRGEACSGSVYTTVPKSRGQPWWTIDSGVRYDSTRVVPGRCDRDDEREHHVHTPERPDRPDRNRRGDGQAAPGRRAGDRDEHGRRSDDRPLNPGASRW